MKTNRRESHTEKWTSKSVRGTKSADVGQQCDADGRVTGWRDEFVDGQWLGGKLRKLKMKVSTVRGMEISVCQLIGHVIHENLICATVRPAGVTAAFPKSCPERGSDSWSAHLKHQKRK